MFKVSNFCDIIVRSYVQGVRVRASNLCEIIEMSYVQCIRASNFFNFKTDEKSNVQRCPCSASTWKLVEDRTFKVFFFLLSVKG